MAELDIQQVEKTYSRRGRSRPVRALGEVSLHIQHHEFAVLLGPSGCGKSTLLRLVAGLEKPDAGRITCNGRPVDGPSRERGMIFQDYALFPWRTVLGNIAFGPEARGVPGPARRRAALESVHLMGLGGFEHRYPHELSGGMRQRVAIARVLINDPDLVLMDEPFASLDAQTRTAMQLGLLELYERAKKTVLFVTHSVEEALILGDTVHVMSPRPGRVKLSLTVGLPRPRDPLGPGFIRLRQQLLRALEA
jgi:ABC-type nitrate/sulfonate/bicarbonate transport system ATPase subunit